MVEKSVDLVARDLPVLEDSAGGDVTRVDPTDNGGVADTQQGCNAGWAQKLGGHVGNIRGIVGMSSIAGMAASYPQSKWIGRASEAANQADRAIASPVDQRVAQHDTAWRLWLRRARNALGLTQVQASQATGLGRSSIQAIEAGAASEISPTNLLLVRDGLQRLAAKAAVALEPAPDYQLPRDLVSKLLVSGLGDPIVVGGGRQIPVIGSVPGGPTAMRYQWSEATAEDGFDSVDLGSLPESGTYFAVRVDGDSMEPSLRSGDIIVCTPLPRYEDIDPRTLDGRVVVVQFTEDSRYNGETALARWRIIGDRVVLTKDNPKHFPLEYPDDGVHGVAVLVELRRRASSI